MGLFRKSTSVFTMGLVDFRSDKERTARSTRLMAHQARKQTRLLKQQNALLRADRVTEVELPQSTPEEPFSWKRALLDNPWR